MTDRHFANPFHWSVDGPASHRCVHENDITQPSTLRRLRNALATVTDLLETASHAPTRVNCRDESVYAGVAGHSLWHFYAARCQMRMTGGGGGGGGGGDGDGSPWSVSQHLEASRFYVSEALAVAEMKRKKRMSFLHGSSGPYALAAVLSLHTSAEGQQQQHGQLQQQQVEQHRQAAAQFSAHVEELCALAYELALPLSATDTNEVLYGRAGLLYAFAFVYEHAIEALSRGCENEGGCDLIRASLGNLVRTSRKVYACVIRDGVTHAAVNEESVPLMYAWHNKRYLGAAHGLAGILYVLLALPRTLCDDDDAACTAADGGGAADGGAADREMIRQSVDYLLECTRLPTATAIGETATAVRCGDDGGGGDSGGDSGGGGGSGCCDDGDSSGGGNGDGIGAYRDGNNVAITGTPPARTLKPLNFASSVGNASDRLVHWCHGATGMVFLLVKAYEIFGTSAYLTAAKQACESIWKRGLLRKGVGLCHGVAGGAYAFLYVYRTSGDPLYLTWAVAFASFAAKVTEHEYREWLHQPDEPWSLYLGLGGLACLLESLCSGLQQQQQQPPPPPRVPISFAGFPGFSIPTLIGV